MLRRGLIADIPHLREIEPDERFVSPFRAYPLCNYDGLTRFRRIARFNSGNRNSAIENYAFFEVYDVCFYGFTYAFYFPF